MFTHAYCSTYDPKSLAALFTNAVLPVLFNLLFTHNANMNVVQSTCSHTTPLCAVRECCSIHMFITTFICAVRGCCSSQTSFCAFRWCCSILMFITTLICAVRGCCSNLMFITTSICAVLRCCSIHMVTQRLSALFSDVVQSTCSPKPYPRAVRRCCSSQTSFCAILWCCSIHMVTRSLSALFADVVQSTGSSKTPLYCSLMLFITNLFLCYSLVLFNPHGHTTPIRAVRRCCSSQTSFCAVLRCCSTYCSHTTPICAAVRQCWSIYIFITKPICSSSSSSIVVVTKVAS
jgi:hypothetical protein